MERNSETRIMKRKCISCGHIQESSDPCEVCSNNIFSIVFVETSPATELLKMMVNHIDGKATIILTLMFEELNKADKKYEHDKMSPDEIKASLLTLKCEVGELEREVERIKKRPEALKKEAIQSLAMAYKFLRDVVFKEIKE